MSFDTCCAGDYAAIERIFDDTPGAYVAAVGGFDGGGPVPPGRPALPAQATDPVAAVLGHIRLGAQREPDIAGGRPRGKGIHRGATPQRRERQIDEQRGAARPELIGDGAVEFASAHPRASAQRQLGVDRGDQVVGNDVGEALQTLKNRKPVTDLAHDR